MLQVIVLSVRVVPTSFLNKLHTKQKLHIFVFLYLVTFLFFQWVGKGELPVYFQLGKRQTSITYTGKNPTFFFYQ